ncbi:MAG: hypothetical protein PHV02_19060, partial [Rhodocyclaceae bacterium]|nr:hypothetical protein [Rhodocyclaceae bacterium]
CRAVSFDSSAAKKRDYEAFLLNSSRHFVKTSYPSPPSSTPPKPLCRQRGAHCTPFVFTVKKNRHPKPIAHFKYSTNAMAKDRLGGLRTK